jgi:hypothetical protein
MNARERARFEIKRVADFGTANATDFTTPVPPAVTVTAAQTKAQGLFDALNHPATGLLATISANATTQQSGSGDFHGGATAKSVLRDALMLELRGLNRSAVAIAEANGTPALMDSFRMPYSVSDVTLAARARAMGQAAQPLATEFEALGHETTFVADLEAHVTAFESADSDQNAGEETQAGATANFDSLLSEALGKVKSLDAIIHNIYKSNAAKLGAWKTASHVERQPKAKKAATTPTPTP